MADQDEAIKIVIEVVNKFAKPLEDVKRSLRGFDKEGEGAGKIKKSFDSLRQSTTEVTRAIQTGLGPALTAFNVGSLSVATAIGGMVAALRGFAESTTVLSRLSRETGFSIDKMKQWEAIGRRIGVTADETRGAFRGFYENIRLLRLGLGNAPEFYRLGLGRQLDELKKIKDNETAFDYILNVLDHIAEPAQKRIWLKINHLPEGWAAVDRAERDALIAEYKKTAAPITPSGVAAATGFTETLERIRDAWSNLLDRMAQSGTLDALTDLLEEFRKVLVSPELGKTLTGVFKQLTGIVENILQGGKLLGYSTAPAAAAASATSATAAPARSGAPAAGGATPGASKEEQTDAVKEGASEGVVEGLKKMMLEGGGGAEGVPGVAGGASFGGAPIIRASLGGGTSGGYSGGGGYRGGTAGGGGRGSRPSGGTGSSSTGEVGGTTSVEADQSDRPGQIHGSVTIDGHTYGYGSGGRGRGSIPYGDYPVNIGKGDIGPVGQRIGSVATVGGPGGEIMDPKYPGRPREGIQIHPGSSETLERLYTQGCFAVLRSQWPAFKADLLEKAKQGPLMLHVGRDGRAQILTKAEHEARTQVPLPPSRPQIAEPPPKVPRERLMDASLKSNQATRIDGNAKVRVDLNGFPKGTKTTTDSDGVFKDVELHRGRMAETEVA